MNLPQEELRCWSRYVRNNLVCKVACYGEEALTAPMVESVRGFIARLKNIEAKIEVLRYSRIHLALMEISAVGSRWPSALISASEEILRAWQDQLGSLSDVRGDIWGPGGRLEGVPKETCLGRKSVVDPNDEKMSINRRLELMDLRSPAWNVEGAQSYEYPLHYGHNGFAVGSWWINLPSAYKDGIIHGSPHGITADHTGAFAVVMTNEEVENDTVDSMTYIASPKDPGRFKLSRNMTCHNLVRILRTCQLRSKLAPKAGVRYDGLYSVVGFGVGFRPNKMGEEEQRFTFKLARYHDQDNIVKALCHPTPEELDDWHEYEKLQEEEMAKQKERSDSEGTAEGTPLANDSEAKERDSGYFSRRVSTLDIGTNKATSP